jgi:hypothetical protein
MSEIAYVIVMLYAIIVMAGLTAIMIALMGYGLWALIT